MVKASPHKRQKGCGLCSPHKHRGNGDPVRAPWVVNRELGKKRRWGRHDVEQGQEVWPLRYLIMGSFDPYDMFENDEQDCQHGCNGYCVRSGSERCTFMCHPSWEEMFEHE